MKRVQGLIKHRYKVVTGLLAVAFSITEVESTFYYGCRPQPLSLSPYKSMKHTIHTFIYTTSTVTSDSS